MKLVDLKIISEGNYYDFYYSVANENWQLLCKNVAATYLSTSVAGGFTGTTIGLYATTKRQNR